MNIRQAIKALQSGNNVKLIMTYWERKETREYLADHFGIESRECAFRHDVTCEKRDFADSATFHRGSKSDCRFNFELI